MDNEVPPRCSGGSGAPVVVVKVAVRRNQRPKTCAKHQATDGVVDLLQARPFGLEEAVCGD